MKSMTAPRVLPISLLLVAPTGAPIAKSDEKSPSPRRDVPFAAAMVPLLLHHGSACGSRKSTLAPSARACRKPPRYRSFSATGSLLFSG